MEKVEVISEFYDIETGKLHKVGEKLEMPEKRVSKQIMLGLVKRVGKEIKQETPNKEKTEETKK